MFEHKSNSFINIDSAKIYYETLGDPQKQPLVLLHGGFGNIEDFNDILPLLEKEYRIIGIDSRGQGKSTLGVEKLSYARIEKDVETIIHRLKLENPVILGFSDGGIAALRLAASKNVVIDKLIVIGTEWHSKSLEESKGFLSAITAESWKNKFPETYEAYQRLNLEPDFDKLTSAMVQMWTDESTTGFPNERVQQITCSTLIVRGDNDHLVSRQSAFELAEIINKSHLANIPFCSHEVIAEKPKMIADIINSFLK
jgi:pimeloyl-ACP methyl ester carboxylesterase